MPVQLPLYSLPTYPPHPHQSSHTPPIAVGRHSLSLSHTHTHSHIHTTPNTQFDSDLFCKVSTASCLFSCLVYSLLTYPPHTDQSAHTPPIIVKRLSLSLSHTHKHTLPLPHHPQHTHTHTHTQLDSDLFWKVSTTSCLFSCPYTCLLYTSPSPRDRHASRMPSSA